VTTMEPRHTRGRLVPVSSRKKGGTMALRDVGVNIESTFLPSIPLCLAFKGEERRGDRRGKGEKKKSCLTTSTFSMGKREGGDDQESIQEEKKRKDHNLHTSWVRRLSISSKGEEGRGTRSKRDQRGGRGGQSF